MHQTPLIFSVVELSISGLIMAVHESEEKCTGDLAHRRHKYDSIPESLIEPGLPFLTRVFR